MGYDTIIVVTPKDFKRLQNNYYRYADYMHDGKVIFVGSEELRGLVDELNNPDLFGFLNENEVLEFDKVHSIMKDITNEQDLPRGITGWYYQQFIKMNYCKLCNDEYYLVWDGDTIPCRDVKMFNDNGTPYIDLKSEYHEEYFKTLEKIIPGLTKNTEKSYIAEHMLMSCSIMNEIISAIENNDNLAGDTFFEKILRCIDKDKIKSNSFSEFETFGTYVTKYHNDKFEKRVWHSFRYGADYYDPNTICDRDFLWLGKDFSAISFEKGGFIREDHKNIFDNPYYQEKFSAKQILLMAQEDFEEGYIEVWDD